MQSSYKLACGDAGIVYVSVLVQIRQLELMASIAITK